MDILPLVLNSILFIFRTINRMDNRFRPQLPIEPPKKYKMQIQKIKRQLLPILMLLLCSLAGKSQVEYLRLSPAQKIIQRVGATDVTIEFSRPQMKGRKIFGELIPYGKMWRTGANENTTINFTHRVKIGATEVAEGTYSLLTKPNEDY